MVMTGGDVKNWFYCDDYQTMLRNEENEMSTRGITTGTRTDRKLVGAESE